MEKEEPNDTRLGLSEEEVVVRLRQYGYNELATARRSGVLAIAWEVAREPMLLLLLACGAIYLLLGDLQEAVLLLICVFGVLGITFYQYRKTERALEALRDLSSPRALVVRGGERQRIAGREVVPGDILVVSEGDRVAADAVLLSCRSLATDESLLTGESVPVSKIAWDGSEEMGRPGGDNLPFVFSGSLVVQGHGLAQVRATGMHTEVGRIGRALENVQLEDTLLQTEVRVLVWRVALLAVSLCVIIVLIHGLKHGEWLQAALVGITLAMAILPEEFPVVLTVFLALGAWRLSKTNVLARRSPVIETLGAATVLCVDKTGTLTRNRMTIRTLMVAGARHDPEPTSNRPLPNEFCEIVEFGILASQRDPFDPMEKAFHELGSAALTGTEHLHADWQLVHGYPLSSPLMAMSHVWKPPGHDGYVLAAKGAPEAIADLCRLDAERTRAIAADVATLAHQGLRVLGVARGSFAGDELPREQSGFTFEFLGLVGLADPLRPSVPSAVKECHSAGIRVVMITGDHPATAEAIARQAGIFPFDEIITGPELDTLDESVLQQRMQTVNVFARVVPEQKLRLVNALKANGEVVAMTGDGVNDAPALKAAHIGIAMGGRGTDVAREAASLVLLDDDFGSIVRSVRMGRRIFDHLQKAMTYLVAVHVPIAGMSLIPVLFGGPLVLLPVHVLFLELVIDPACSIVFEAERAEAGLMQRRPRGVNEPLLGRRLLGIGLLQGASVLLIVLGIYLWAWRGLHDESDAIALSFTTLVVANLGLIFANRSWSRTIWASLRDPNPALWWVLGGTLTFLILALSVPFLRGIFHFSVLHPADLLICLLGGAMSILWFELLKAFRKKDPDKGVA